MRDSERDLLLVVLAISAGSADGWSYFGLGHAFVANMTGNTVLVGMSALGYQRDLLHPAIAIGCFVMGVMLAAILTRRARPGATWPRQISASLLLESILLIGAEIAWAALSPSYGHAPGFVSRDHHIILGAVAFAMGMQTGAMLQLKIPGVVTTYISMTYASLTSGLVRFASGKKGTERKNLSFEERLLLQGAILAVYFFSAMFTGWVLKSFPSAVGAIPGGAVLIVAVFGMARGDDSAPAVQV
jgi:uncharacterized membrane protein YoaK (UPF0700 family)